MDTCDKLRPPVDLVWKELREDFPATKSYVWLNATAASPPPPPVAQAVIKSFPQYRRR